MHKIILATLGACALGGMVRIGQVGGRKKDVALINGGAVDNLVADGAAPVNTRF